MLELSGEIADGVITHGLAPSHLDFALARITAGAAAANRPGKGSDLFLMFDFELDEDRDAAVQRLRKRCMFMVGGSYAEELIPLYGLDPDHVRPIRAAVSRGEFQTAVDLITPKMVEAFAAAGDEQTLQDTLELLASRGVDGVILSLGGQSLEEALARIERAGRVLAR